MNFVAMDFETASAKRFSACSLALTIVRNDQIVDEFYSLINPQTDFSWRNTQVHGLTQADVADAPIFPTVWDHVGSFFDRNKLVIAHNAPFDNGVLKSCLAHYGLEQPIYQTLDTVRTSRKFFPEFPNHKLNTVCDQLEIELNHHHNALDDSQACANILLYQEQHFGIEPLRPFVKVFN